MMREKHTRVALGIGALVVAVGIGLYAEGAQTAVAADSVSPLTETAGTQYTCTPTSETLAGNEDALVLPTQEPADCMFSGCAGVF